jgi:hypothetical protein
MDELYDNLTIHLHEILDGREWRSTCFIYIFIVDKIAIRNMICKAKVRVRFPLLPYSSFRGAFVHPIFLLLLFMGVKRFFIFLVVAHLPDWICLAVGWNPCRLLDRAAISSCWCRHCSYRCCGAS